MHACVVLDLEEWTIMHCSCSRIILSSKMEQQCKATPPHMETDMQAFVLNMRVNNTIEQYNNTIYTGVSLCNVMYMNDVPPLQFLVNQS